MGGPSTTAKSNWFLLISGLSLLIAIVSLGVSGYLARETQELARQSQRVQEAALRPILVPGLHELSFDRNYIKIVVTVANRGPTAATISCARVTVYEEGGVTSWIEGLKGAIIPPDSSRQHVFKMLRNASVSVKGGAYPLQFDPRASIAKMGDLPLHVTYESQQLPGVTFTEDVRFPSLPWHDKSIIGVGN